MHVFCQILDGKFDASDFEYELKVNENTQKYKFSVEADSALKSVVKVKFDNEN